MTAFIFADCAVLDGTRNERREDHHVLVEDGRIREVSDRPIKSASAETIELAGRTLMPGLIDAHVHVLAVDAALARLSDRPVTLLTLQAAKVLEGMLQRGFTTVRDAAGADGGLAEAVEEGLVRGPRIFPSGMALSQTGGHGDTRPRTQPVDTCACCAGGLALSRIADGVAECRRAARDELRKGATQIKIVASGGVASPYDPIWNLQYSEEEVRAIVEEARAWHTYVMAHAYSPEAIRRSIDFGVRSIEHANLIDRATAEHVAGADAFVVPTLVTYDALHRYGRELGFPEVSMGKLAEVREAGLGSLEILQSGRRQDRFRHRPPRPDAPPPVARIRDPRRGDVALRHHPLGDDRQCRTPEPRRRARGHRPRRARRPDRRRRRPARRHLVARRPGRAPHPHHEGRGVLQAA